MVDQTTYQTKQTELKQAQADTQRRIEQLSVAKPDQGKLALKLFDFSQKAGEVYKSSKSDVRRQILTMVTSNRTIDVGSLCLTKRRPFDLLIEGPSASFGRTDKIRTCAQLAASRSRRSARGSTGASRPLRGCPRFPLPPSYRQRALLRWLSVRPNKTAA